MMQENPQYINYFIPKNKIFYPQATSVYSKKRTVISNKRQIPIGYLIAHYKFYSLAPGDYELYAWFWAESLKIHPDSSIVVIKSDNLRIGSNQHIIGRLEAGTVGKMIYSNDKQSWVFIQIPFYADTEKISYEPPKHPIETYDYQSDGNLPDNFGPSLSRSLALYIRFNNLNTSNEDE